MTTDKIELRWEWRCFAPSLAALECALHIADDASPSESNETYILALTGFVVDNVKIRDDVLEVKRLLQTDANGLEQWEPVLKARFPISREDVDAALAGLALSPAASPRGSFTVVQFLDEIVEPCPDFRAVKVHKSRSHLTVNECSAELVQLSAASVALQSFALEHEDPGHVLRALRSLGLDSQANMNYPRGLKRALGFEAAS